MYKTKREPYRKLWPLNDDDGQYSFISCNKCASLVGVGVVDDEGGMGEWEQRDMGNSHTFCSILL